jgi:hypothetical protein
MPGRARPRERRRTFQAEHYLVGGLKQLKQRWRALDIVLQRRGSRSISRTRFAKRQTGSISGRQPGQDGERDQGLQTRRRPWCPTRSTPPVKAR